MNFALFQSQQSQKWPERYFKLLFKSLRSPKAHSHYTVLKNKKGVIETKEQNTCQTKSAEDQQLELQSSPIQMSR